MIKRIYLLSSIFVSILFPLASINKYIQLNNSKITEFALPQNIAYQISLLESLSPLILIAYGLGVAIFIIRFIINIIQLVNQIRNNEAFHQNHFSYILIKGLKSPFTFYRFIFVDKNKFQNNHIPKEVLLHEQTHVKQKHSFDILFIELAKIVFWFNPIVHLINKSIKLNHEFLADQAVISRGTSVKHYQNILLTFTIKDPHASLVNAINFPTIKKRFNIMKTQSSKRTIWFKSLLFIPLFATLFYSFSSTNIIIKNDSAISSPNKATKKQVAEFNNLAKYYNNQPRNNRVIKWKDIKRLEYLYGLMSRRQKNNAEPFPECPPPPPPPPAPQVPPSPPK